MNLLSYFHSFLTQFPPLKTLNLKRLPLPILTPSLALSQTKPSMLSFPSLLQFLDERALRSGGRAIRKARLNGQNLAKDKLKQVWPPGRGGFSIPADMEVNTRPEVPGA